MAVEKDPLKEMQKDFGDQFASMKKSLEAIAKSTGEDLKESKTSAKHEKERGRQANREKQRRTVTSTPGPKVELGKQTRKEILSALKNIRSQIVVSQRKETTASDVAADTLASGGSLVGAAKAAAAFKAKKTKDALKRKFDPLNIIHRMTGGSKLATALAGKVMGRSEKSIRGAAGLSGGVPEMMQEQSGSPTQFEQSDTGATQVSSGKSIELFEKMSSTLFRIEGLLEDSLQQSKEDLIREERLKDAAILQNAKDNAEAPMQVKKDGAPAKDSKGGWFAMLLAILIPVLTALGNFITTVVIPTLAKLANAGMELLQSLWKVINFIKTFAGDAISKGIGLAKGVGTTILEGAKNLGGKLLGSTPSEVTKGAAGAGKVVGEVGSKVGAQAVASAAKGNAVKEVIKKVGPGIIAKTAAKAVPLVGLGFAVKNLIDGDYTQAAIDAAMGIASVPAVLAPGVGSSAVFATGLAATIANQSYKQIYGIEPLQDPEVSKRMPELVEESKNFVTDYLAPKAKQEPTIDTESPTPDIQQTSPEAKVPDYLAPKQEPTIDTESPTPDIQQTSPEAKVNSSPIEIPAPVAEVGRKLNESQAFQRDAAMTTSTGETGGGGKATIVNVKNNNSSSTTVHQNMAPARSGESSYLRSIDRGFVGA